MMFDTETILLWQQRGISARVLGLAPEQNPLLKYAPSPESKDRVEWELKSDAWLFGWRIEDAQRNG